MKEEEEATDGVVELPPPLGARPLIVWEKKIVWAVTTDLFVNPVTLCRSGEACVRPAPGSDLRRLQLRFSGERL